MNQKKIFPDDPRLTAYALGELDASESAEVAHAIAEDPSAQATVDEVRALAGRLEEALADEPIEPRGTSDHSHELAGHAGESRKVIRFPFYLVASLAAACFAVLLILRPTAGTRGEPAGTAAATVAQAEAARPAAPVSATPAAPAEAAVASAPASGASAVASVASTSATQTSPVSAARRNRQLSPLVGYGTERPASPTQDVRSYAYQPAHGFLGVAGYPLSSFSTVVGTESYANVRRFLRNGRLPPPDAVRVEELLNYFSYGSIAPRDANPLAASLEVAAAPWNPTHRLVRIGLKGRDLSELEKVAGPRPLLEETLGNGQVAVAKDVKLQVEFNPEQVKSYRLIGYEDNSGRKTDANGAKLPGADMPAGGMITALYELVPMGAPEAPAIEGDPLRYGSTDTRVALDEDPKHRELLTLKLHYKLPVVEVSQKMEIPLIDTGADFSVASKDFKFAAAVAGFGMLLTESPHKGNATYDKVLTWAQEGQDKEDKSGKRREFIDLVKRAKDAPVE